jgi:hypothetical protein
MGLTRKQIKEGLDTIPMSEILGISGKDKGLTHKQQTFARELAKGTTKAEAYRRAYKAKPAPSTILNAPYRLAADARISAEVEAYKVAIESAKHRTPEALRQLVIKTLVDVAISPDSKDAVKVQAVKVLGTVVEVGAFLERKEVHHTSSAAQAKHELLKQLRTIMNGSATDAVVHDVDSLMQELETLPADTHPPASAHAGEHESQVVKHTIPHERTQDLSEDPPHENP